jgi:hypothetical protein
MKALERNAPPTLPRVPVARLVGHEGPIQTVRFTGMYASIDHLFLLRITHTNIHTHTQSNPVDDNLFALGLIWLIGSA